MQDTHLLHDLVLASAQHSPERAALTSLGTSVAYGELAGQTLQFAQATTAHGLRRGDRVGIYLDKRFEFVVACFGAAAAGGVFVPINPALRAHQLGHIVRDCSVRILVTSTQRLEGLRDELPHLPSIEHVVLIDTPASPVQLAPGPSVHYWPDWLQTSGKALHRVIDTDVVAILYTSGSTGKPKGVVLSHRNMLMGAKSVAQYLGNHRDDVLLAALPLSFDAGFSQLTTAFHAGARVVLLNYLLPQDVVKAMAREGVTGLTAVPPLWIQLAQQTFPATAVETLRYFANTGGRMPLETLTQLRRHFPRSKPYLMYGLTEAFRATYLPPEQVDKRPDSIGQAIPNSEVLVLRPDGTPCEAHEPGELVQRGPLVALGYWNDAERTAERFRALPADSGVRDASVVIPEVAVFSGDVVRRDEEGYLYFIGRRDEMIKTSGYRVSPTEVEEEVYATGLVGECAALGVTDTALGQAIVVIATPTAGHDTLDTHALLAACKTRLPAYMVPRRIEVRTGNLPRNPNGKIDRVALAAEINT